ncbi:carbon monoxide dehydrogenase subunit G [Ferrovibrio sp.]|uniref:SRPBCC family protein n=1 Tax=Ferrovibrio sp. TaxID=1917215 RepID=UPI00311F7B06
MELTGEQLIPAPRDKVWAAINDPEILRQCITGAETVTKTSDTDFEATVQVKVGPVKAKFKGKVSLTDLDPPNGCTITGEAQGGVAAGFGKGSAEVKLADAPGGTRLTYAVKAQIGGKLAQIGARLVDGVAAKMAEEFFSKFNTIVAGPPAAAPQEAAAGAVAEAPATAAPPAAAAQPATVTGGIPSWLWIAGLIVIVGAVTILVLRG